MEKIIKGLNPDPPGLKAFATMISILFLLSCQTKDTREEEKEPEPEKSQEVTVITTALNFIMPPEIASGWTTFRYMNQSNMTHFFTIGKMPVHNGVQMTVENSKTEVVPVFRSIMDSLISGGEPPYDQLPEWSSKVRIVGGSGLIGPQKTAETTVKVDPGIYVIECYMKNPGGVFHSAAGMITGLVVTGDTIGATPPEATIKMTLSSERGIEVRRACARPARCAGRSSRSPGAPPAPAAESP